MNQEKIDPLLKLSLKRLPLENVDSRLKKYKEILKKELKSKGLTFDFHLWVSDEWFCPDGVPGFAVPFYLFNKKLMKIQKEKMGFVDGTTERKILMLMRHELGHAIDNAYGLRNSKKREAMFGSSKKAYPISYSPQIYSSQYVKYLGEGYAQSHPDEDFAETFAFWLDPQKKWKKRKSLSQVVRQKLMCMDDLMKSLKGKNPKLKNKFKIDPIENNKITLNKYYMKVQKEKKHLSFGRLDNLLLESFKTKAKTTVIDKSIKAEFNKKIAKELSVKTGLYQYEINRALEKVLERAQSLGLSIKKQTFLIKSHSIIETNYRYLKENHLLKYYL